MQVRDPIANLEARVLERHRGPMRRARQCPHERVTAGLQHAERARELICEPRDPRIAPAFVAVPRLAHEADPRGRVGNDRVDGLGRQLVGDRFRFALK